MRERGRRSYRERHRNQEYHAVVISTDLLRLQPSHYDLTPPPACTGVYWGEVAIIDRDASCLPSGFNKSATDSYFSPGVACPAGYVSACHDTAGAASITTVTCCPSREDLTLSCVDPATLAGRWSLLFCTWIAPETQTVVSITLSDDDSGKTSTVPYTMTSPDGVNAYGIRMVHQATDLVSSTTGTAAVTSSTTSDATQASASATALPDSPDDDGNLSTGAKAAIGVIVLVVALGIAGLLFYLWRRRRRESKAVEQPAAAPTFLGKEQPPVEYDQGYGYYGAGAGKTPGVAFMPSELSGQGRQFHELEDRGPPVELPADTSMR
ncbi:hypothetical protein NKR23_g11466 [Pleurostoma richardsiae]|uniref:Uncharacterized protein n=1 Tax=Pleurostoma richardsiae TaxID=41990 RepID=A0AA38RBY0_9PEZI|nr:hypothetical protein NKR23_g11466 [Pleurostoma richardsiae]